MITVRSLRGKSGCAARLQPGTSARRICGSAIGLLGLLGFLAIAVPAMAATTPVSPGGGGDPNLLGPGGILDTLYGLANLTRIDDFAALPNDELWVNPDGGAVAQARFAGFANEFGYFAGDTSTTFVSLFTVSGTGFSATGSAVFTQAQTGSPFRFALKTPPGDEWSSRASDNADALDHLVTFRITGGLYAGDFVIAWEDLPASSSDTDYNDLVIQVHQVFPHECSSGSDCPDDGNECTSAACVAGACVSTNLPSGTGCTDGDACTSFDGSVGGADACDGGGTCRGTPVVCNDGKQCTADACVAGSCVFTDLPSGASCDDGNVCTLSDTCTGGVCRGTPSSSVIPPVDIVIVIETSVTMRRDLRLWIPEQLGPLPSALENAGITDWRLAIVRFGTSERFTTRPQNGPPVPDVPLDWTTDATAFQTAVLGLQNDIRRATEAGTEAVEFALDKVAFRPNAVRNVILYTDEDDDSPVCQGSPPVPDFPAEPCVPSVERREPPGAGPGCYGRSCEARWEPFQQRIDHLAARLIVGQIQLNIVENPGNRPVIFQYGDPGCTRLVSNPADPRDGLLDPGPTLACLRSERQGVTPAGVCTSSVCSQGRVGKSCAADSDCDTLSLQAQLLGSGVCAGSVCTGGRVGSPCSVDADCAILARAYKIPKSPAAAAAFFPGFIDDKIREQGCLAVP